MRNQKNVNRNNSQGLEGVVELQKLKKKGDSSYRIAQKQSLKRKVEKEGFSGESGAHRLAG